MKKTFKFLIGALASAAIATGALAADITGAGASFPFPIYVKWAGGYKAASGTGLNYQSIGSGGGIAQIRAKTVTFGATDAPLTLQQLNQAGLAQFPTVIGGVVPVVNIRGVAPGALTLDGATLANIFMGRIARWNDAAIKKLNPQVNLPDQAIVVVHRSDGSGTTFIFASYLAKMNADWKSNVGAATSVDWPVGIGAKGNEGVAANVAQNSGSIGYVEYAYAKQNRLAHTLMINKEGKTVAPTVEAFRAASASADWEGAAKNGFYVLLVDQAGAASWPITATTYILVYKQPVDQAATSSTLKFFDWAFKNGDQAALSLDYVPLPENAVASIEASWKQIQGSGF
jgi:phosphate transport system substrate-binding protein